ncbi:hypothetical protein RSAG8_13607, partial [Rhizoctonia solani AG-8 WAC10335]
MEVPNAEKGRKGPDKVEKWYWSAKPKVDATTRPGENSHT